MVTSWPVPAALVHQRHPPRPKHHEQNTRRQKSRQVLRQPKHHQRRQAHQRGNQQHVALPGRINIFNGNKWVERFHT